MSLLLLTARVPLSLLILFIAPRFPKKAYAGEKSEEFVADAAIHALVADLAPTLEDPLLRALDCMNFAFADDATVEASQPAKKRRLERAGPSDVSPIANHVRVTSDGRSGVVHARVSSERHAFSSSGKDANDARARADAERAHSTHGEHMYSEVCT